MKMTFWVGIAIFEAGYIFSGLISFIGKTSEVSTFTIKDAIFCGIIILCYSFIFFMAGRDTKEFIS